jgi:hypothetical protein
LGELITTKGTAKKTADGKVQSSKPEIGEVI